VDPDIALFAAIVEAGSLSAAGRALAISPAMVSKRLARLEARLGVRLVHRTTRRLELTARGQRYHRDVVDILAALRAAEDRVADRSDRPAGPLRITAPTSFGRLHIAPRLKTFLDLYPEVEFEIDLSDDFVDLLAGGFDLAIRITPRLEPGLTAVKLADSRRILCAAPRYLAECGAPADAASLRDHAILAASGQLPWRLLGPNGDLTIDGKSHVRTNSSEVVRELTLAGVGIALRSLWDISDDLAAGRLIRVLPELQGSADVGIFAVYPKAPMRPATIGALLGYLGALWDVAAPWERPAASGR
jgi:DNA-binding transcriptional LysR family regulator